MIIAQTEREVTNMENKYLKILKKFNPFLDAKDFESEIGEEELPPLVKNILQDVRKEKELTYVDAYAALEIVYKVLRRESNFVSIKRSSDD